MSIDSNASQGFRELSSGANPGNSMAFMIERALSKVCTACPVAVKAVDSAALTVTVQPLVLQLDGQGQALPQTPIYNVPYSRIQGGGAALIVDPMPGDIGWCVFAQRDISGVKATRAESPPGSMRTHDAADAIYLGGILNQQPSVFIRISESGVNIQGNVTVAGDVVADGISLKTHVHTGAEPGPGNTGGPA